MGRNVVHALRVNPGDKESAARHERDARRSTRECPSYIQILGLGLWGEALAVDTLSVSRGRRPKFEPARETGGQPENDVPNGRTQADHATTNPAWRDR